MRQIKTAAFINAWSEVRMKNRIKTKKHNNKRLGSQREQNLLTTFWKHGYTAFRMSLSAGGYPLFVFREKFPEIYRRTGKNVRPIDLDVSKYDDRWFIQVSKYYDDISSDEIEVLIQLANDCMAVPVLAWIVDDKFGINKKGWKFCQADNKNEVKFWK
jgi:Holliday junction resolvase